MSGSPSVVVTHNMQQAARVSDWTTFLSIDLEEAGSRRTGLVDVGRTERIVTQATNPRTEAYITGRDG